MILSNLIPPKEGNVKRFAIEYEGQATEHPFGPFMLVKDHEARVAELEAKLENAVGLIVDHLWDSHPSVDLRDKAKLETEIRALIDRA